MSRWVMPRTPGLRGGSSAQTQDDDAIRRIAKYVPAEVIAPYAILLTLLASLDVSSTERQYAGLGLIALFFLATVAYLSWAAPKGSSRRAHYFVSPLAFLAWSYPISSSALDDMFYPLVAFTLQALTIVLSLFVRPVNQKPKGS